MRKTVLYIWILTGIVSLSACGSGSSAQKSAGTTPAFSTGAKNNRGVDSVEVARLYIDACKFLALEDYNTAVQTFEQVLQMDPNNAPTYYQLAKIYIDHGQVGDALTYSDRAANLAPQNKDFAILQAGILNYSGQFLKAADVYLSLIAKGLSDINTYYQLAACYEKANNKQKAINTLLDLHKQFGIEEDLAFELQRLYAAVEDYDEAIYWLNILINLNPDNTIYLRYLSDYYERNGEPAKAKETFDKLITTDPGNTDLLFKKADMQKKSGDIVGYKSTMQAAFANPDGDIDTKIFYLVLFVDSIGRPNFTDRDMVFEWTELLVQAHPEDAKSFAMRGDFLYYDNQLQAAADVYNQSLKLRNDVFDVWLKMFYIYADLKKYDSLYQYATTAVELYPNQAVSYYFGGVAANQQDMYTDGIQLLRRGLPLAVSNTELRAGMLSLMGDAYHALGDHTASDDAYEKSIQLSPQDVFTLNNYAYYLSLRKEKLDRAAELALSANKLNPGNASLQDTYAWVLYQQGNYAEARIWVEKALSTGGEKSGVIHEHYGDILYRLGETEQALEQWKKARQLGETSEQIEQKIASGKLTD